MKSHSEPRMPFFTGKNNSEGKKGRKNVLSKGGRTSALEQKVEGDGEDRSRSDAWKGNHLHHHQDSEIIDDLEDALVDSSTSIDTSGQGNDKLPQVNLTISYSFHEEQLLAEQFYRSSAIAYTPLSYAESKVQKAAFQSDDEYWVTAGLADDESQMLTVPEAEESFREIQYSAALGRSSEVNTEEKRKFDLWIKFNPALFKLFESLYAVTRDVNYAPLS